MKYSIVIPCYNEEKNIKILAQEFEKLGLGVEDFELILVQNGSVDNTKKEIEKVANEIEWIRMVNVPINKGYGYGIKQGLENATGDFVGWMHADLQFSPSEIKKAMELHKENGYAKRIILKGKRINRPIVDSAFTFGMSCFESILLGKKLYDINAQPTIFDANLYKKYREIAPDDFSIDLFMYYVALSQNYKLIRWNAPQSNRLNGESSWNTGMGARLKLIKRTLNYSFQLRKKLNKK